MANCLVYGVYDLRGLQIMLPGESGVICTILLMFPGLGLYHADPSQYMYHNDRYRIFKGFALRSAGG